jgi:beta-galactosidase
MLDWQRFTSDMTIDFFLAETAPLRRLTPEIPITTNFQMPDVGLDYHDFAQHVDIISWDNYPEWHRHADDTAVASKAAFFHDLHRSYKHQPFLMMESSPGATSWQGISKKKKPAVHILSSIQALAHGSASVQYFQWRQSRGGMEKFHDAVISHLGADDTPLFRDVQEVSTILEKLAASAPALMESSRQKAQVAVIYDYQNGWALHNAALPRNQEKNYQEECIRHYGALWSLGIPCDVIDCLHTSFDQYKLILMPMLYMLREESAEKIRDFVRRGGVGVATYLTGLVNGTDLCYLGGSPGNLTDVFGLAVASTDVIADYETQTLVLGEQVYRATHYADELRLRGASVLGVFRSPSGGERPAVTAHDYGAGQALYLAARTDGAFLRDFLGSLCEDHGLHPCVPWEIPPGVSVQKRGEVLFVMNFTEKAVRLSFKGLGYYDILHCSAAQDRPTLPAYGLMILRPHG